MYVINKMSNIFNWLYNKLRPKDRKEEMESILEERLIEFEQVSSTNEVLFQFVLDLATARNEEEILDCVDRAKQWTGIDDNYTDYLH
tara:strand:+ start:127 stop:387 length:261 start_codon:yes stop_codon:yes gene_type:complete